MPIVDEPAWRAPVFFGRQRELEWLSARSYRSRTPLLITGGPGVGKTTLLNQFLTSVRVGRPPLLLTLRSRPDQAKSELFGKIQELYRDRDVPEIVAIEEAEALSAGDVADAARRLLNLKAIRSVIFVTRQRIELPRAEALELAPLEPKEAYEMLKRLLANDFPSRVIDLAASQANGLPLALTLIAGLARGRDPADLLRLLRGEIYDLGQGLNLPERRIITEAKPRIILANEALVERLRHEPQSVFQLPSRKFEELIAELLSGLGYEVELTPETRDGGKDILAYMSTPHGRLLCLVEAKRYRQDRPVGVQLVRQLYGTLVDAEASSAMMVTTSSFSADAKAFQKRHQYRLALRDYGNIVSWIEEYKKG